MLYLSCFITFRTPDYSLHLQCQNPLTGNLDCDILIIGLYRGATSVVKTVTQKGTKEKYAMKQIKKNVSHS